MNIEKYVAVSGLSGLHKIVSNRSNGLVLEDLETGKVKFASTRQYQFNPIASIGIYVSTEEDTISLSDVFKRMLQKLEELPLPDAKADKTALMQYLEGVLPEYDKERVYPSDVKRLVKWFAFLNDRNLLSLEDDAEENLPEETVETTEEKTS